MPLIIPREPGVATSKGKSESGDDQHRAASRDKAGNSLAPDAGDLARVRETKYRTKLAPASVRREWFPAHDLTGGAIQHQLRALLWLTAGSAIDVERELRGG